MNTNKRRKILLVDDEVGFAEILRDLLVMDGYEVILVNDGEEALDQLNIIIPDLVISDIMMPKVGGLELYHKIREIPRFSNIPFLFISGFEDNRILKNLHDDKLFGILNKPIDMEQIQKALAKILRD